MQGGRTGLAAAALLLLAAAAWAGPPRRYEPISPIPAPPPENPARVALGRQLFLDPLLSRDGSVSCGSCHNLAMAGIDGLPHAIGIGGAEEPVNTPTVYNAALNLAQFWDGRADSLEEQAGGPVTNPREMGSRWPEVIARLEHSPYRAAFQRIDGGPPTPRRVEEAIASFERTLLTPDSPFDRWLKGDDSAISPEAAQGYALFKSYGCSSCHQGANVGGNMFQRFGFYGHPLSQPPHPADLGRYAITGQPDDRYVFKVPSLRLAVLTPPYFHDGSVPDLATAIRLMGRYQLGRAIPDGDITLIIRFLDTLPGNMTADDGGPRP